MPAKKFGYLCLLCQVRVPKVSKCGVCRKCLAKYPPVFYRDAGAGSHKTACTDDYLRLLALRAWLGAPICDGVPPGERGGAAGRKGDVMTHDPSAGVGRAGPGGTAARRRRGEHEVLCTAAHLDHLAALVAAEEPLDVAAAPARFGEGVAT